MWDVGKQQEGTGVKCMSMRKLEFGTHLGLGGVGLTPHFVLLKGVFYENMSSLDV